MLNLAAPRRAAPTAVIVVCGTSARLSRFRHHKR